MQEIQMVTGVQSDDLDFLVYMLLKDGCYFGDEQQEVLTVACAALEPVENVESWFGRLRKDGCYGRKRKR